MNQSVSILYQILEGINRYHYGSKPITAFDISRSGWFHKLNSLDTYGTTTFQHPNSINNSFTIFHSESDMVLIRNPKRVSTIFIVYDDVISEIGDIIYDAEKKEYTLENYRLFNIPPEIHALRMDTCSGQNGFLYYPKDNIITLKMDLFSLGKLPSFMVTENKRAILRINPNYMRKLKIDDLDLK